MISNENVFVLGVFLIIFFVFVVFSGAFLDVFFCAMIWLFLSQSLYSFVVLFFKWC